MQLPNRGGYNDNFLSIGNTKNEKGIAAILIVLHHLSQRVEVSGPLVIMGYTGFVLVAVFFFVSGYGLEYGLRNKPHYLKGFFRKRILPVLMPYWIVNSIDIVFYLLKGKVFTPAQYILSYLGIDFITGTWFVAAILLMYISFWIAFRSKESYIIFGMCMMGYCIICFALNLHSSYTASIAAFVLGVIWNKIGIQVVTWIRKMYSLKLLICVGIFGFAFLGRLVLSSKDVNNQVVQFVLRNLVSVSFVICLIAITQKVQFRGKVLEWLGNISYELYIVHSVLLTMFADLDSNIYI